MDSSWTRRWKTQRRTKRERRRKSNSPLQPFSLSILSLLVLSFLSSLVINCEFSSGRQNHKMLIWSMFHLQFRLGRFLTTIDEILFRLPCWSSAMKTEMFLLLLLAFAPLFFFVQEKQFVDCFVFVFVLVDQSEKKPTRTVQTNVLMMLIMKLK